MAGFQSASAGEFVQESLRMRGWLEGFAVFWQPEEFAHVTSELAAWFEREARIALGRWTNGVEAFRSRILATHEAREDLFLITRRESLHNLNKVGTEVMNRGFQAGFENALRLFLQVRIDVQLMPINKGHPWAN